MKVKQHTFSFIHMKIEGCLIPSVPFQIKPEKKFPKEVVGILSVCTLCLQRAYNTKKQAEERPMSMWISNLKQIEAGRELFGELTWAFMKEVWPSTISLVVNKGKIEFRGKLKWQNCVVSLQFYLKR